jgi:hypothetical protein
MHEEKIDLGADASRRWPPLRRWQVLALAGLALAAVGFGVLVEIRSAFLSRRMGDLTVFLRTAWAVRTGQDIYAITDPNGFHYHYPPLLAILLVPLADPPAGADTSGMLPYPLTVALWYGLSILFLVLGVHRLAGALEDTTKAPADLVNRRRWALRLLPILVCLPPVGHTLMRGQVSLLLLLLLAGMTAALLRRRSGEAGLWLAGAICLKVIPAYLLVYPLWRRDVRCLAGCALGLVLGMAVIPAAVFGPARTWAYYEEWTEVLIRPGLGAGTDQSRTKELIAVTATDSQSFLAVLHNTLHPDGATRPANPSPAVRRAHWLIGGVLTLLTLLAARWRRSDGPSEALFLGQLTVLMLLLSPVCHLHYFCLSIPLVLSLLAALWERDVSRAAACGTILLLAGTIVANTLPHFGQFQRLRDDGLAMYAALSLWLVGCLVLWQRGRVRPDQQESRPVPGALAA